MWRVWIECEMLLLCPINSSVFILLVDEFYMIQIYNKLHDVMPGYSYIWPSQWYIYWSVLFVYWKSKAYCHTHVYEAENMMMHLLPPVVVYKPYTHADWAIHQHWEVWAIQIQTRDIEPRGEQQIGLWTVIYIYILMDDSGVGIPHFH